MNIANPAIKKINILSSDGKKLAPLTAPLIREVFLTVKVNGEAIAKIACSGNHLKELAAGFLKSEKIINTREEIEKIEVNHRQYAVNIILDTAKEYSGYLADNLASSGARSRENEQPIFFPPAFKDDFVISAATVLKLMDDLLANSVLHNKTHGTHCSALAKNGTIAVVREDIGRHNTIDMLGGHALLKQIDLATAIILTTGRISSEIVCKILNLGIPVVISHAAPTARAVDLARQASLTLIGYVRRGSMNIYSHERRITI